MLSSRRQAGVFLLTWRTKTNQNKGGVSVLEDVACTNDLVGIMATDNRFNRECGVKTVVDMQRGIHPSVYLCPWDPRNPVRKDVWQLRPSFRLDLIPSWIVTVEENYREPFLYGTPIIGQWMNRRLVERIRVLNPTFGQAQGDQNMTCEHLAHAFVALGWEKHLWVQLHTDSPAYINSRIHVAMVRRLALEGYLKRSRFITSVCGLITGPSEYFIKRFVDMTGCTKDIELFPSIIPAVRLMDPLKKAGFRKQFLDDAGVPETLWDKAIVGGVGRVSPEKNLDEAVQAHAVCVKRCKAKSVDTPILIYVGECDAAYLGELKSLARRLGTEHLVFFVGERVNSEAVKFLQICSICLLLSLSETQGLVRREAQLAGSIPIVRDGTALKEGLDDSRLIFPDDADAIGEWMFDLLEHPDLMREIAEHQLARGLYDNDLGRYSDRYLSLIDRVRRNQ